MIFLFDLNGTLGCQRSGSREWVLRPNIQVLKRLQDHGFRIGLFTNKRRRNIPVHLFAKKNIFFDVILDQDDCEPPESSSSFTRRKSLRRHFPLLEMVRLVDDDVGKGLSDEQHLLIPISKWTLGQNDDKALLKLVDQLLFSFETVEKIPNTKEDASLAMVADTMGRSHEDVTML
jgi:hypothetical protein